MLQAERNCLTKAYLSVKLVKVVVFCFHCTKKGLNIIDSINVVISLETDYVPVGIHFVYYGYRLHAVALFTDKVATTLVALLDGNAAAYDLGTSLAHYVGKSQQGLTVGKEIIDDQHLVARFEIPLGHEYVIVFLMCEGIALCRIDVAVNVEAGRFLRKQHGNFKVFGDSLLKGFEKDPEAIMATSIVDWGHPERTPNNTYGPLYLAAVQACRDIANLLGEERLAARCDVVEKGVKARFQLAGLPKSAAAWAALTGLSTASKVYKEVLAVEPTDGLSTFHFDNFLRVYRAAGETQKALDLLRKYYGGMLKLGSRTIWEQFELPWMKDAGQIDRMPKVGKTDVHRECGRGCFQGLRNSLCHGWGASPIAWMMETIAGISPVGDGFSRGVKVSPNLCDLDYVSAICPTPYGDLTIMARRGEKLIIQAPKELKVIRR